MHKDGLRTMPGNKTYANETFNTLGPTWGTKSGLDTESTVFAISREKPGTIVISGNIIMKMHCFFSIRKDYNSRDKISRIYETV